MDLRDVIAMAMEVAVQVKAEECELLMRKKQKLLADEAAKQQVIDEFMVFIDSIEKNDMEAAQNFDEKAMMNTILTMMNGSGGKGGFAADDGKK